MDINSLTNTLLAEESLEGVSKATGASSKDVLSVLAAALPSLLNGANTQATSAETASGFANALQTHAADDTSNLLGFLTNADLKDGNSIIGHLLGSEKESTTQQISQQTGVSSKNTGMILACIAPLLMSLLGKSSQSQSNSNNITTSAATSLMSGLLGGNSSSVLTGLLGSILGGGSAQTQTQTQSSASSGLLGSLFGGGSNQTASAAQTQSSGSSFNPLNLLSGLLDVNPDKSVPGNDGEDK